MGGSGIIVQRIGGSVGLYFDRIVLYEQEAMEGDKRKATGDTYSIPSAGFVRHHKEELQAASSNRGNNPISLMHGMIQS
jgi:hypothetical protein